MPDTQHEPSRLELYKAGKLEERRSPRPPHVPKVEEVVSEAAEEVVSFKLRPEMVAIVLMVIVLLVLTLVAM